MCEALSMPALSTPCVEDLGFRWWSNLGYYTNALFDQTLSGLLQSVGDEYTLNTDLAAGSGPNGEGEIRWVDGNYGATPWSAVTIPYWGSTACADWNGMITGNCNTTTKKANRASIYFNLSLLSVFAYGHTMPHEMGHVVGLAHNNTLSTAIMYPSITSTATHLLSCEIEGINAWY